MPPNKNIVAEILKQPNGPEIGAFFDFDGTLISGYSASAFLREQIRRGHLPPTELIELLTAMASFGVGNVGNAAIMRITANESTNENEIVRYSNSDILSLNNTWPGAIDISVQSSV